MRIRLCAGFFLALCVSAEAADAVADFGAVRELRGICEASATLSLSAGAEGPFLTANDENHDFFLHGAGADPLPLAGSNLDEFLGLRPADDDDDKADLEGAAWLNGTAYWIGSHSRSGKGRLREQRWKFFSATPVTAADGTVRLEPQAGPAFGGLLPAIAELDPVLKASIALDKSRVEELAPDNGGFNIEGLAAHPDGTSLVLALRSPLKHEKAVLLRLANPGPVALAHEAPQLSIAAELDLGKRGVRSIEHAPTLGLTYILAGPSGDRKGDFTLFEWRPGGVPELREVPGFAEGLARLAPTLPFKPEAMAVDASGKIVTLMSDEGDTCNAASPAFRAVTVTIP